MEARFRQKISPPNETGCMLWTATTSRGYGKFLITGKKVQAHRLAYELAHGEIPVGQVVRHKCDIRACCNVEHLELGTHADNMRDKVERGRQAKGEMHGLRGEKHSQAKLTEEQVREIRASPLSGVALGRLLNVSDATISDIRVGRTWSSVV